MTRLDSKNRTREIDAALRRRARQVIPGGMYGHLSANNLPPEYPQFYSRSEGSRVWDVDGNEYLDLMCSFGPVILGHKHPKVEAAVAAQFAKGDTQAGPAPCMVELAELLVDRVSHADWAMFAKNGSDANTVSLMIARAATGRNKVLAARGAYHGSAPWSTPVMIGVTPEDRASVQYYTFNDLASVEEAVERAAGDLAAIIVSPFKHDAGFDQELVDPAFARGLRELCDRNGAALVLDEVRAGFRLNHGGSWETVGVEPDLSAWSKAIANGYALAAVLGSAQYSEAASRIFVTGSFWFQAVPMAAAVATITALREESAVDSMLQRGAKLRDGIEDQARSAGVPIRQTGPVQLPNLRFLGDENFERSRLFSGACAAGGLIVHPRHNWFVSAALTDDDVDDALAVTEAAFAAVREQFNGA
ncbi:MAG TPA: aminotransferase class III-fold pyridoxal phosphate-dependent enzyme [Acidimicrobiales bacterium]|nr:aminotransferase class III-fold pyridoxal phosphate-dependent enzyme [Acidimicrobiales bacterium]